MITVHLSDVVGVKRFEGPDARELADEYIHDNLRRRRNPEPVTPQGEAPAEQAILLHLSRRWSGHTTLRIADALGLARSTLSRQLNILARRGLVKVVAEAWRTGKTWELTELGWAELDRGDE